MAKTFRFLAWPDTHVPYEDTQAVRCALKILQWYRPHEVVILGDFLDCAPVSRWLTDNRLAQEGLRLANDFAAGNQILDKIQKSCKKITYLEGNHEDWIRQAISRSPELKGLIDLELGLRFEERGVKSLKYGGVYKLGKLWFTHGTYTGMHHAKKHVEAYGRSIVYGHLHDLQLHVKVSPMDVNDKHLGLSLGCLAAKNPQYMKNRPNNWTHAVGVGLIREDGTFNIDPIIISKGTASYAGKTFRG